MAIGHFFELSGRFSTEFARNLSKSGLQVAERDANMYTYDHYGSLLPPWSIANQRVRWRNIISHLLEDASMALTLRRLLKVRDLAELLNAHPRTIYMWIRSGELPPLRVGKRYRCREEDIRDYLMDRARDGNR
jgi:excisionase family DNA binding protein